MRLKLVSCSRYPQPRPTPMRCVVGVENQSIPNTNASIPHHMYAFGIIRSFKVPNPIRIPFLHKSMLSRLGHLHVMLERRWQYLGLAMHPRKPTTLPGIRESQPSLKSRGSRTSKPDHKLRVSLLLRAGNRGHQSNAARTISACGPGAPRRSHR